MKNISSAEKALIHKDFHEVWDSKLARNTIMAVPLVLVLVVPVLFLVIIATVPASQMNGVDKMMKMLPLEARYFNPKQGMFYIMTNMLFPMFFLMIPLMSSSVAAASSFVGERERGTLETLLLTPLNPKRVFKAKVIGCILLSALVSALSFLIFAIVISVGDIMLKMPFFLNWSWLVLILLFAPGVTVFGVVFMVLVSAKSKSYIESVQTSGYIILPLVLLFLGEFTGLFTLNAVIFLVISICILILDVIIWTITSRSFKTEKLLK